MQQTKKISVIGGGLGGLAYAQAMRLIPGFQVTVFERDEGPDQRSQGYHLGLTTEGIAALRTLKIPYFEELVRVNPITSFSMMDQNLEALYAGTVPGSPDDPKRSLLDRWKLRDMLTQGLTIQWDKKFVNYEEKDDCVVAHFDDGSTVISDLLVGADGVNSKVRAQYRPDLTFQVSGTTFIAGHFPVSNDTKNELPVIKSNLKSACRALLPQSHGIVFMKFKADDGTDSILWCLTFDTDYCNEKFGELNTDIDGVKDVLVQRLGVIGCSPELLRTIALTPAKNLMLPTKTMTMKPTKDAHIRPASLPATRGRVVILGDAAHAMTTHAGRGASTAFSDAVDLAECSKDLNTSKWNDSKDNFEKILHERGYDAVSESLKKTNQFHKQSQSSMVNMMLVMGFFAKTYNLFATGRFAF